MSKKSPQEAKTSLAHLLSQAEKKRALEAPKEKPSEVGKAPTIKAPSAAHLPSSKGHGKQKRSNLSAPEPSLPPSSTLAGDDLRAYMDAYRGVTPNQARKAPGVSIDPKVIAKAVPISNEDEAAARNRMFALVGGAYRYDVHRESDGYVRALRVGASSSLLIELERNQVSVGAELDLHGLREAEADSKVVAFVRGSAAKGLKRILVVTGKGLHSNGVPVLQSALVRILTESAAPWVLAFASAPVSLGGVGAVVVSLDPKK